MDSQAHENRMGWIPNTETDYVPSNPDNPQKRRATKCIAFKLKPLQKDVHMCTYFRQRPNTSKSAKEARARSCTPASSETKMANAKRRACRGREHGQGVPSEAWPIMSTFVVAHRLAWTFASPLRPPKAPSSWDVCISGAGSALHCQRSHFGSLHRSL